MDVIVIASQKGGAGKTTLASHLAVEAERQGAGPVILIDMDPQGGLASWYNAREAETPAFLQPQPGALAETVATLRRQHPAGAGGADDGRRRGEPDDGRRRGGVVLIDTPPAITASIAATIAVADLVLVPARPSPNDLRAIPGTVTLVQAASKPMVFVINCVKPRVRLTGDAAIVLSQHGTVSPAQLWDRTDYAAAMIDGRTAPEITPGGKAAAEVAALWSYVALRLQGRTA